jgi:peptide chain release factor subunit 1
MLTETNLQELLNFQTQQPVLSIYLNTDPTLGSADAYKLRLRNMFKEVNLPKDVSVVEKYFDREYDWSGRSVAVFSCEPEKFFRVYPLAVPVRDRVRVNNHPHVKPLARLLDHYGGYGVILIDKQSARLFNFHMGELMEEKGVIGENVRRTKRGGSSTFPGRRGGVAGQTNYADEAAERNMREIADRASRFFAEKNVRRVLIGGTEDNLALFRSSLPKSWQSLIVGSFPMRITASKDEVHERAMKVGQEAENRDKEHLVKSIITNTAKEQGGVLNLEDTLKAAHEGRVSTLVIRDGFRAPGYVCKGCGYLTGQQLDTCPYCGSEFSKIGDAVEMAVRTVLKNNGEVEVLAGDQSFVGFDNIGALLRY